MPSKTFVKYRMFDSVFVFIFFFLNLHIAVKYFGILMILILKHHLLQHNPDPLAIKVFFCLKGDFVRLFNMNESSNPS